MKTAFPESASKWLGRNFPLAWLGLLALIFVCLKSADVAGNLAVCIVFSCWICGIFLFATWEERAWRLFADQHGFTWCGESLPVGLDLKATPVALATRSHSRGFAGTHQGYQFAAFCRRTGAGKGSSLQTIVAFRLSELPPFKTLPENSVGDFLVFLAGEWVIIWLPRRGVCRDEFLDWVADLRRMVVNLVQPDPDSTKSRSDILFSWAR